LRNIENGEIVRRTRTDQAGRFSFSGLRAGQYIVEVVGTSGDLVAASAPVSVTSGKRPVNAVVLSVPTGPRAAFVQTGSVRPVFSPVAGEIIRAAVLAGITGSSIKVNASPNSGGWGNDTEKKKKKSPKKPDTDKKKEK
jgi:hypothetical protein